MKKTSLISVVFLAGAILFLSGCAQKTSNTGGELEQPPIGLDQNINQSSTVAGQPAVGPSSTRSLPESPAKTCTYDDGGLSVDAACNQLLIGLEQGYLKTTNEFQAKVLNLIEEYKGKIFFRSEASSVLGVELPDDKQIYELKDKLKSIGHVNSVHFNQVVEAY